MTTSQMNLLIAAIIAGGITYGLHWFITNKIGLDVAWGWFALFFLAVVGAGHVQMNEASAAENLANMNDKPKTDDSSA